MSLVAYPALDAERLAAVCAVAGTLPVVNAATADGARAAMPTATAFYGKLTPELLAAATGLRWVQSPTASLEHYLFPELVEHACLLTNMRGLFSDVVADHVFGYILCFARNLHLYIRRQRWEPVGGEAARTDFVTGPGSVTAVDRGHRHVADCTLGVVGVGAIGAEICRRALGFGMTVRLFDAARIARMRPNAVLINVGRGVVVDLAALTAALQAGRLGGAALDVFETEPLPAEHPLWAMENVILTPHIAAASPRVPQRHLATLVENVRRFAAGEPLLNVVDKRAWY